MTKYISEREARKLLNAFLPKVKLGPRNSNIVELQIASWTDEPEPEDDDYLILFAYADIKDARPPNAGTSNLIVVSPEGKLRHWQIRKGTPLGRLAALGMFGKTLQSLDTKGQLPNCGDLPGDRMRGKS